MMNVIATIRLHYRYSWLFKREIIWVGLTKSYELFTFGSRYQRMAEVRRLGHRKDLMCSWGLEGRGSQVARNASALHCAESGLLASKKMGTLLLGTGFWILRHLFKALDSTNNLNELRSKFFTRAPDQNSVKTASWFQPFDNSEQRIQLQPTKVLTYKTVNICTTVCYTTRENQYSDIISLYPFSSCVQWDLKLSLPHRIVIRINKVM